MELGNVYQLETLGVMSEPAREREHPDKQLDVEEAVQLLFRARRGESGAVEVLIERYRPRFERWLSARLPSPGPVFDLEGFLRSHLESTARNLQPLGIRNEGALLAHLRELLAGRLEPGAKGAISPLIRDLGPEAVERYETALDRLPTADREAVIGRIELDYGYTELARILEKPSANAARVLVVDAVRRLAREMLHAG